MRNTNKIKLIFIIFLCVTFTAIARWQVPSNVATYDSLFQANGSKYGVDPILLKAQIAAE
ncbi:MAG: hypothetical protein J6568_05670 [Snodgrassella sp.]|nr:hypothetical protein [Snodgrassella sp.]